MNFKTLQNDSDYSKLLFVMVEHCHQLKIIDWFEIQIVFCISMRDLSFYLV